ncbi:metallophosphoesterase [Sphingomonas sp. NFR04]|uniref:metallophosphoesterase n=1 Tax=Sphingomonas sp. NFR04 TaxID=1566283 RepID=UPI0020C8D01A|nr:metallophosphoesterase [Sphingomonas sp. NFR04]
MTRRRRVVGAAALLLAGLAGLAAAMGFREAWADPVMRTLDVRVQGWPTEGAPVRMALLSDIHLGGGAMDDARLRWIVAQVNAVRPDLVLIAGDMIVGHDASGAAPRAAGLQVPLSGLRARLGVVAVLGNHDHWTAPAAIRQALEGAGVHVLTNTALRAGAVAIVGVDDAYSGHDDAAAAIAAWRRVGGVPILLTHAPDLVHRLPRELTLVLAGHTHCGQVVLPGWGPLLLHAPQEHWRRLYDPQLRCGIVHQDGRTIVVTAGVGSGTMPIRLGAPPDWWLVTLHGRGG